MGLNADTESGMDSANITAARCAFITWEGRERVAVFFETELGGGPVRSFGRAVRPAIPRPCCAIVNLNTQQQSAMRLGV